MFEDLLQKKFFRFYCPQCRAERRLPAAPRISLRHWMQIGITTLVLTAALWPFFGLKGLIVFVPLWAGFELVFRSRMRIVLACPSCGFDPFLYIRDVKLARAEMEKFWRSRYQEKGLPFPGDPVASNLAGPPATSATGKDAQPKKPIPAGKAPR
jgi:RNase P subunit RPR2